MPRPDPTAIAQLAARIVRTCGAGDVALAVHRETVLFARGRDEVRTGAVELIRGVYETAPRDAHFILRNTIFATREPGPFAQGMVKVGAKRLRVVLPEGEPSEKGETAQTLREVVPEAPALETCEPHGPPESHDEWLRLAFALIKKEAPEDLPRHARDRHVGAALVAPGGQLLAASANSNGSNRTRHAELNVLLGRWHATGTKLAPGTRLYATLRPCAMCAGLLWELSEVPGTVLVYYAHDDPGSAARNTILCPGSPTRARFARSDAERAAPGCTRVPLESRPSRSPL
jgi:tRNA(Arg) A34 adenosine deaminase TadA